MHRPQAEIDNEEAHDSRKEARDRQRLVIEAAGLGVAVILAFATVGLWVQTRISTHIAALAADAAQRSAKASEEAIETTKHSVDASIQSFQMDQRAWVGVQGGGAIVEAGQPIENHANVMNAGKTSAFQVSDEGFSKTTDTEINDMRKWVVEHKNEIHWQRHSVGTLLPGSLIAFGSISPMTIGPDYEAKLKNGTSFLYMVVNIYYLDVFGVRHTTKWCGRYIPVYPVNNVGACEGNYAQAD